VYGDSLKDVLVAVVVPDIEVVKQQQQWGGADLASLCLKPEFKQVSK
jgi:hypothetical protein